MDSLEAAKKFYCDMQTPVAIVSDDFQEFWANECAQSVIGLRRLENMTNRIFTESVKTALKRSPVAYIGPDGVISENKGTILLNHGEYTVVVFGSAGISDLAMGGYGFSGDDVYANVIRNSVDGISITADAVMRQSDDDDPNMLNYFAWIKTCAYRILRSTNNRSLVSKFENGTLELKKQNCDIRCLVDSVCSSTMSICKKFIPIDLDLPDEDIIASVDRKLLERALFNVLLNAIVYKRDGNHIEISAYVIGNSVNITVRDHGAGIKPELLPFVKEPYFSSEPAGDGGAAPGLGLGLTIANLVCIAHNGTMVIDSEYGVGTKVAMSFEKGAADGDILKSCVSEYVTDRFSQAYVELCDICNMPS